MTPPTRLPLLLSFPLLTRGTLLWRKKRFLCGVELSDGSEVEAHCPNPGRMTSVLPHLQGVYLTDLGPPTIERKLRYRWELALLPSTLVGVNTGLANRAVASLFEQHPAAKAELGLAGPVRREVSWSSGDQRARFDFQVGDPQDGGAVLEVKQVTLRVPDKDGIKMGAFPDAVTLRGRRHLDLLGQMSRSGLKTILLYVVMRGDIEAVRTAGEVDPDYRAALKRALANGVQCRAVRIEPSIEGLRFGKWLPFSEE